MSSIPPNPIAVEVHDGALLIVGNALQNVRHAMALMLDVEPWWRRPGLRRAIKLLDAYIQTNQQARP